MFENEGKGIPAPMSANTKGREHRGNNDEEISSMQSIIASSDEIKTADIPKNTPSVELEIISHLPDLYKRSALFLQSIGKMKINGCDEDADA